MRKQFTSILMAIFMILSMSLSVSAAETKEFQSLSTIVMSSTVIEYESWSGSIVGNRSTGDYYVGQGRNLKLVLRTDTGCNVVVYLNGVHQFTMSIPACGATTYAVKNNVSAGNWRVVISPWGGSGNIAYNFLSTQYI